MRQVRFAKFAWGVLAFNIAVILWGAFVRASGSGAGCGSHWPLCNGEVVPADPALETIIEFTHRLSSGLALVLVFALFIWGSRIFGRDHAVRLGVRLSLIFIITEALVGAGLVLFSWVGMNDSLERVISMAVHLVNTFLLLASLTLTAWWASGGGKIRLKGHGLQTWIIALALLGVLVIGVTGAITALGDTLFPSNSLAQGIQADFSPTAHFVVRLRVWHPLIAGITATYVFVLAILVGLSDDRRMVKRFAAALGALFVIQLIAGLINLFLLAPVAMQIIHLLLADLVWIFLVLFSASIFGEKNQSDEVHFHFPFLAVRTEIRSQRIHPPDVKEGA